VRGDFRVGLGDELVAFGNQLMLQLEVVFDDAVVHDNDLALAVPVWMRVFFRGPRCAPSGGPMPLALQRLGG
jgi:hypothetical protein